MLTIENEFRTKLRDGLRRIEAALIEALKQIIDYKYPPEVFAVCFEVFPDSWSNSFPVRTFFLDASNNEHFVYVDGEATYPSPIDPGLIEVSEILPYEFEISIRERDPGFDYFTASADEFIAWFAPCWNRAGGIDFPLLATVADHDSDRELNLKTGEWQNRHAAFSFTETS